MSMPKAAMNKDCSFQFRQNNIRLAGYCFVMELVTKAICEKKFPNQKFRLCVFTFDLTHVVTSRLFVVNITHATKINKAVGDCTLLTATCVGLCEGWQANVCNVRRQ